MFNQRSTERCAAKSSAATSVGSAAVLPPQRYAMTSHEASECRMYLLFTPEILEAYLRGARNLLHRDTKVVAARGTFEPNPGGLFEHLSQQSDALSNFTFTQRRIPENNTRALWRSDVERIHCV